MFFIDNKFYFALGAFSSYLPFDLITFLRQMDATPMIKPEDFPLILMKLHAQFNWPYPISINNHLPEHEPVMTSTLRFIFYYFY